MKIHVVTEQQNWILTDKWTNKQGGVCERVFKVEISQKLAITETSITLYYYFQVSQTIFYCNDAFKIERT